MTLDFGSTITSMIYGRNGEGEQVILDGRPTKEFTMPTFSTGGGRRLTEYSADNFCIFDILSSKQH